MIWNIQQVLFSDHRSEGTELLLDGLQRQVEEKWSNIPSKEIDKWLNDKRSDWITESFSIKERR